MTDKKTKEPYWRDGEFIDLSVIAENCLGPSGRMLYRSKSQAKPTTIFNVNIFDRNAKKIWFGDLEIERDREALISISEKLGPLYILWEMHGRFLSFVPTRRYIEAKAIVTVASGRISYNKEFAERIEVLTKRAKAPKKKTPILMHMKSGEAVVGPTKERMKYDIYHSPGNGPEARDYMAITSAFIGGYAFGKTPGNALRVLKRLHSIHKPGGKPQSTGKTETKSKRRTK
ncbi:MAG: hypothetical protein M0Z75_03455 [Nitrospiraceae bacterium]|nr:hypothetical protein [Nitrospiraceae bacterium]MDA8090118.1 hypothetical protein [Nitrospiraceae bacterium]